jgi:hypothetical protein
MDATMAEEAPDGGYTLTYVPRDQAGATGEPASASAMVLTAIALANPSKSALHVSDADSLARSTMFTMALKQPALLTRRIVDAAGSVVRLVRDAEHVPAGTLSFSWDGRDDDEVWVGDGTYRSVVYAQTGLGAYVQQRSVFVGAFQITASNEAPTRGERVTLNLLSTESLDSNPSVQVTQDGFEPWTVTARHVDGRRYRLSIALRAGGPMGAVEFQVSGADARGGRQSSAVSFPLQ